MSAQPEITADAVRQHLIERATAFSARTNTSLSAISTSAVQDSKFLANVKKGHNFTLNTYQRVMDWLDHAERTTPAVAESVQ